VHNKTYTHILYMYNTTQMRSFMQIFDRKCSVYYNKNWIILHALYITKFFFKVHNMK